MNQTSCCEKCNDTFGKSFFPKNSWVQSCKNSSCSCHTIPASTEPKDSWEERFDKEFPQLYRGYPEGTFATRIKSFISSLLAEEREKGRQEALTELPALQGEEGKLFSTVIAKAMEAPFVEVALQYIVMRVAEKYKKEGYAAGRKSAVEGFDYLLITSMPSTAENLATITERDAKITIENLLKALSTESTSK